MIPIRTSVAVHDTPAVVVALIGINVAAFLVQVMLPEDEALEFLYRYALVPALFGFGANAGNLLDPGLWLRLVTNTFLHGGLLHLAVNMWTLWLFGRALQERIGAGRFLVFYLLCGAIASLAHLAFNLGSTVPALGASGAIAGVLGAFTVYYPRARITFATLIVFYPLIFPLPALVYSALWFGLQLLMGTAEMAAAGAAGGGIAWWAHVGGFAAGVALAFVTDDAKGRPRLSPTAERPRTLEFGPRRRPGEAPLGGRTGRRRLRIPEVGPRRRRSGDGDVPVRSPAPEPRSPWEPIEPAGDARAGDARAEDAQWDDIDDDAPEPGPREPRRRGPWG